MRVIYRIKKLLEQYEGARPHIDWGNAVFFTIPFGNVLCYVRYVMGRNGQKGKLFYCVHERTEQEIVKEIKREFRGKLKASARQQTLF